MEKITQLLLLLIGTGIIISASSSYLKLGNSEENIIPPIVNGVLVIDYFNVYIEPQEFLSIIDQVVDASEKAPLTNLTLIFSHDGYDLSGHITTDSLEIALDEITGINTITELDIRFSNNLIGNTDFGSLANLPNLTSLRFSFALNQGINDISSLAVVGQLSKLQSLWINFARGSVDGISFAQSINSENNPVLFDLEIDLWENQIEDVEDLKSIGSLSQLVLLELKFQKNEITDVSVLTSLGNLTKLHVLSLNFGENYELKSIDSLSFLSELHLLNALELTFHTDKIVKIDVLENLGTLTNLLSLNIRLENNRIKSPDALYSIGKLTQLKHLTIFFEYNPLTDKNSCFELEDYLRSTLNEDAVGLIICN